MVGVDTHTATHARNILDFMDVIPIKIRYMTNNRTLVELNRVKA